MSEKCGARTKLGNECRAAAVAGKRFCAFHGHPERAAQLGQMGGRKNRHYAENEVVTIAPPSTPEDIRNLLAQSMADVRARKLEPRIASTLTYMASALLKAIESTDVQQRLRRLEEGAASKNGPVVTPSKGGTGGGEPLLEVGKIESTTPSES